MNHKLQLKRLVPRCITLTAGVIGLKENGRIYKPWDNFLKI